MDERTIVLVRCIEDSDRLNDLVFQLCAHFDESDIFFVPDCTGLDPHEVEERLSGFEGLEDNLLPLTNEFVEKSGLHFSTHRTGWLCGDYVFYRALEEEWTYAWVIEPDVYFLNSGEDLLATMNDRSAGLICTAFHQAPDSWVWAKKIHSHFPEENVHQMYFPLVRMSRELAEASLAFRQKFTPNFEGARGDVPNDESVVATAAAREGVEVVDLLTEFPAEFRYWSTLNRVPVNDLIRVPDHWLLIHSGMETDSYLGRMQQLWHRSRQGDRGSSVRLWESLQYANHRTVMRFLKLIIRP